MASKRSSDNDRKPGQSREDRLKAALKANLARRKAQSRVRATEETGQNKSADTAGQDKDA